MFQVNVYRFRAEDCARRAQDAQDEFHRKNYQQLSEMWAEMADKAERRAMSARREVEDAVQTIRLAKAS